MSEHPRMMSPYGLSTLVELTSGLECLNRKVFVRPATLACRYHPCDTLETLKYTSTMSKHGKAIQKINSRVHTASSLTLSHNSPSFLTCSICRSSPVFLSLINLYVRGFQPKTVEPVLDLIVRVRVAPFLTCYDSHGHCGGWHLILRTQRYPLLTM
jgi:hypothetical protein